MKVAAMALIMMTASPIRNSTSRMSLLIAADGVATARGADESGKLENLGKSTSAQEPPDCLEAPQYRSPRLQGKCEPAVGCTSGK